jgi:transposase
MESVRKPTYSQNWREYTLSQTNEKAKFLELLFALCEGLEEPPQSMGRPRVPVSDRLFSAVYKVYSTVSARRFTSDLREARQRGFTSTVPTYVSVSRFLESEELTPVLRHLIVQSSLPLKSVESDFAVDSSGFATGRFVRWFDVKHGGVKDHRDWLKIHIMCGVKTNIITAVEVTGRNGADSPQFAPLLETTARGFEMREVSADKAYSSRANLRLVVDNAAVPYIPFKENTNPDNYNAKYKASNDIWKRMYHFYEFNREHFKLHYHKRSNVETTFSMIKAKFGERLRSRTDTARVNEVLCKVLCHNLCCLIHSIYELGVEVSFETKSPFVTQVDTIQD